MAKKLKYSELERALAVCEAELADCKSGLADITAGFLEATRLLRAEIKVKEFIAKKVDEL